MRAKWWLLFLLGSSAFSSCITVPFTGRSQWNLVDHYQLNVAVDKSYHAIFDTLPAATDTLPVRRVQRTGQRLVAATEKFLRARKQARAFAGCNWVFNIVNDHEVNAYALPGGKIFITSRMVALCSNDTLLAAVLGHEIGHVLANHAAESYSRAIVNTVGAMAALATDVATSTHRSKSDTTSLLSAYQSLSQIGIYACSRKQEAEADRMGLIIMALAAYPPSQQSQLWQLLEQQSPGQAFAFTNTHPTPRHRGKQLQLNLPEAYSYWQGTLVKK